MATLREIRRQIQSIGNIEKITQAMEMVAGSRLRKAQVKAEAARPYFQRLKEILDYLLLIPHDSMPPLAVKREVKKTGFVIIAGDRGLCGGYNQAIFSTAEKKLKGYSKDEVVLLPIGRKVVDYFKGKGWLIQKEIPDWGGKITFTEVQELAKELATQFLAEEIDEIWIVYTHYINIAARTVMIEKLLPIEGNAEEKIQSSNYIFEPDADAVFAEILPRYCVTHLQSALNESYASELGARIFAMRAATKNAEEMLEKLTLTRNKIRQAGITRELIEITSCVESLK